MMKRNVILCRIVFGIRGEDGTGQWNVHLKVHGRAEACSQHATVRARAALCRSAAYCRAEDHSADRVYACFAAKGQRECANPDSSWFVRKATFRRRVRVKYVL